MSGADFEAASERIRVETSAKHIGVARVHVDVLEFPHSRSLNTKNVARLKGLFRGQQGFKPDDVVNRIPAVVTEATLDELLGAAGLPPVVLASSNPDYLKLDFPPGQRLECLRGQHRVEAAKEAFPSSSIYWTVDLFLAGISVEAKQDLIEAYASERKPEDGEFYYKIRHYQGKFGGEPNAHFERRWWGRLAAISANGGKNPTKRLKQLFDHPSFGAAFDKFHTIPALYCGLRISTVDKMTSLRCDEELLSYLEHIRSFWSGVLNDDKRDLESLDVASIRALEFHAPGACKAEAHALYRRVRDGEIFGRFSIEKRETFWSNICSLTLDCLVPSLSGFFDDLKHLKLAADCVKRLIDLEEGKTVRSTLFHSFKKQDHNGGACTVQTGNLTFRHVRDPGDRRFDVAYRVLWLYALREHDEMPAEVKKKLAGANKGQVNGRILFEFASLAAKLGFSTGKIRDLLRKDPDQDIARRLLLTARPPDYFEYHDLESCIAEVEKVMKSARATHNLESGNRAGAEGCVRPPQKKGIPNWSDARRDKPYLFLDNLHAVHNNGHILTSFFIFRSTYFAFFGKELGIDVTNSDDMLEERLSTTYVGDLARSDDAHQISLGESQLDGLPPRAARMSMNETEQKSRPESPRHQEETYLRGQQETVAQLNTAISELEAKLVAARHEDEALQENLENMRLAEAEQVAKIESLQTDEEKREAVIMTLKQTEVDLGAKIQLAKIATSQTHQALREEEDQRAARLQMLSDQESQKRKALEYLTAQTAEQRAALHELETVEGEKRSLVGRLAAEEQRLQKLVMELEENARQRKVLEKTESDYWRTKTDEAKSVVDQLVERERELRVHIDQLRASIDQLTKEEKEQRSRMEHVTAIDRAHQSSLAPLTTTAEALDLEEDEQSCAGSISSPELQDQASHELRVIPPHVGDAKPAPSDGLDKVVGTVLVAKQNLSGQSARSDQGEASSSPQASESVGKREEVHIRFQVQDGGEWRDAHTVSVSRDDPSEIERVARKYLRKEFGIFDTQDQVLTPQTCFERVTSNGSNTIRVVSQKTTETEGPNKELKIAKVSGDVTAE